MITKTTEIAIKALTYLAQNGHDRSIPPHIIAEKMGCSPTYLGKTMSQLVKAGLLRSQRGPQGGMSLAKEPAEITLLEIVEACQGHLAENAFCRADHDGNNPGVPVCGYHQALLTVQNATVEAMRSFSLTDIMNCPRHSGEADGIDVCRMSFLEET